MVQILFLKVLRTQEKMKGAAGGALGSFQVHSYLPEHASPGSPNTLSKGLGRWSNQSDLNPTELLLYPELSPNH